MPAWNSPPDAVPCPSGRLGPDPGSAADAVQSGLQVLGVGAVEVDPLAAAGVLEAEPDRVQPLAFQAELLGQYRVRAVGQVPDAGMAQGGAVNPDLVGTP